MILSKQIRVSTQGYGHTLDVTDPVQRLVQESALRTGVVALFVVGSTAGLTTTEYEPGAVADVGRAFEKTAPQDAEHEHHLRWHDGRAITTTEAHPGGAAPAGCCGSLKDMQEQKEGQPVEQLTLLLCLCHYSRLAHFQSSMIGPK